MKKRILQLTGSFRQGGSERQAVALARMLKRQGDFDVFLATLSREGPLLSVAADEGFENVPEFPLTSFYGPTFFAQVRHCAKYLRENKIDLVHMHDFYTNVFGIAAATLARVPIRIASKRETSGMRSRAQEIVERAAFSRASAVVVNSAAVREYLLDRGIPVEKMSLIYNGIDIERFDASSAGSSIRNQLGLSSKAKVVTMVANLRHSVKNVPMLLHAATSILRTHPETHFVIAGEGELETELKNLTDELGISQNVHFIGRCLDVPELLAASDVCVLTSKAEGFSNSILEYMAAGKPVVATNVGGAAEAIIDGETGFLVAADDGSAMAVHVSQLIADSDIAGGFGAEGRRRASEKFSAASQLASTLALYNSLLA